MKKINVLLLQTCTASLGFCMAFSLAVRSPVSTQFTNMAGAPSFAAWLDWGDFWANAAQSRAIACRCVSGKGQRWSH